MLRTIRKVNIKYVTSRPKLVLLIAFILTLLAGVFASGLSIELNWVALAPKGNEAVKEYGEILEDFPSLSNIMVIVESDNPREMSLAIKEVEDQINTLEDYVTSITVGLNRDFILKYGMLLDENSKDLIYMFKDPNLESFLTALPYLLEEDIPKNQKAFLLRTFDDLLIESQQETLDEEKIKSLFIDLFSGETLLTSKDGTMAMLTIQPSFEMMDIAKLEPGIKAIEDVIEEVSKNHPEVAIGATGMHVVARDETISIQSDSSLTTVLAIVLIFTLLYFAFRAVVAPVLAFIPLFVGIIWGVGLTTLVIGRLNMLTAFAAAMLLGLGVDYAIHLYSSYIERRASGFDKVNAIHHAISITGPGIITGAMTTAVAFFALNISQLEMLRELGTVMGLGIISTLLAVFWILPSMIMLRKEKPHKQKKLSGNYAWVGKISTAVNQHKTVVVIILIISTGFMAYQATSIEFDMNLMNLEPEGLKSIELMDHLVDTYDMSTDSFSISVDSIEDVYAYHSAFEAVDGIKEVASIASFIPKLESQEQMIEVLKELNQIPVAPYRTVDVKFVDEMMTPFEMKIPEAKIEDINKIYYETMLELSDEMLTYETLEPNDLPEAYKSQFVSKEGDQFLITIYPEFNIWENLDTDKGDQFFKDIEAVNKQITGTPIFMKVIFESAGSELMLIGGVLLVILLSILLLHFKSIPYALAALLPLLLTLIFMMGTMSLLDLKFNMLNFLSILLIIGIGIDNGVHILHHYKIGEQKINYLFASVGKAILLTTLTTVCGFGSLIFSSYRGIASLGSALSIGVISAFIMTIVVLPLLLKNRA
ncbi:MAG: MMPL family transporter [Clostridiales bacterium]|nr:MMPL family transporter [Clostridiales bacterium]